MLMLYVISTEDEVLLEIFVIVVHLKLSQYLHKNRKATNGKWQLPSEYAYRTKVFAARRSRKTRTIYLIIEWQKQNEWAKESSRKQKLQNHHRYFDVINFISGMQAKPWFRDFTASVQSVIFPLDWMVLK